MAFKLKNKPYHPNEKCYILLLVSFHEIYYYSVLGSTENIS